MLYISISRDGGVAKLVIAPACQAGDRGFDPRRFRSKPFLFIQERLFLCLFAFFAFLPFLPEGLFDKGQFINQRIGIDSLFRVYFPGQWAQGG